MDMRGFGYEAEHKGIEDYTSRKESDGETKIVASDEKENKWGWKWTLLLLVNQGLATVGLPVDWKPRSRQHVDWDSLPVFPPCAFLSDLYLGRYLTCTVFQIILGLLLLSISSKVLRQETVVLPPSTLSIAVIYLSIYLVALGCGGYQPTLATFGADQFDDATRREWPQRRRSSAISSLH
ncbi:hypothetical protein MLD38_025387 [Melastoma candidum]|uniref:Uncharacterized protein n=1 Tax=Melastoma candidum TaxID=119954 RepID=A0ACB9NWT6_9MYRT|nr:hypothetical protein MLD38_025387 [Melastoma candidum]